MALNDMHAEAVAGVVDRVVARYHRDPTCMVQILREVQEV
ncbi:MAG: NAD(P)-dependent nickel-iron dehydrogenase flavin-containing subunit, partial [Proteobacteria bacterium]|nr:NAD(P)-dependent nickel-iron dehydrogenase flavin-containing subunit [Pseudomonadota bacterium]